VTVRATPAGDDRQVSSGHTARQRVLTFLSLTLGIDWSLVGLLYAAGVPFEGATVLAIGTVYMVVPAAVAIVLARRWRVPLRRYGLRLRWRWAFLLAFAVPMLLAVLTTALAVGLGFGELDLSGEVMVERIAEYAGPEMAAQAREQMAELPINVLLLGFLAAPLAGITINGLFALGEELGWRGLLQRELAGLGFARSSVIIGLIWGIWHAPLIAQGLNYPEHPLIGMLTMTAMCIPLGVLHSWVRLRAGTVLAAAVMHGTFNGLAGVTLGAVRGGSDLTIGFTGLCGIMAMCILAAAALLTPPRIDTDDEPTPPAVTSEE